MFFWRGVAYVVVSLVHPYKQEAWQRAVYSGIGYFLEGLTFLFPLVGCGISPLAGALGCRHYRQLPALPAPVAVFYRQACRTL